MEILTDNWKLLTVFAVVVFLYFLPEIRELFRWIFERAKESQKIGELSRKLTTEPIGSAFSEIRDEMDTDMEDSGMAQGEIESCLNHWNNKYIILRRQWFGNDT